MRIISDDMMCCDSMAVNASHSAYGCNMFVKNSDRMVGESQPMTYVAPADHEEKEVLLTGDFAIPQVPHTYGVTGSGPYWIWGFEMGVNEFGVMIGNEAEFGKMEPEKENGILGMDILRLGLERAKTAKEAALVMAELLEKYGQKRSASAVTDKACYDNSFLIVDKEEVWIMETAGRLWIAQKTKGVCNIGNTYSVHGEFDLASENIETFARERRWLLPDEPFDFARAYAAVSGYQTIAHIRRRRVLQLGNRTDKHTYETLKNAFRDHNDDDELLAPLHGASAGLFPTICRHACDNHSSETTACMIGWYGEFGTHLRWAFSQPCSSLFIPVYYGVEMPDSMTRRDQYFCEDSLWWQIEKLGKLISMDSDRFGGYVKEHLRALEDAFDAKAKDVEAEAMKLRAEGKAAEENAVLAAFMAECAEKAMEAVKEENARVAAEIKALGGFAGPRKDVLSEYFEMIHAEV